jgi:hypothetical protein
MPIPHSYRLLQVMQYSSRGGRVEWDVDTLTDINNDFWGGKSSYNMTPEVVDKNVKKLIRDGFVSKIANFEVFLFGLTHLVHKCETAPVAEDVTVAEIYEGPVAPTYSADEMHKIYSDGVLEGNIQGVAKVTQQNAEKFNEGYRLGVREGIKIMKEEFNTNVSGHND